MQRYILRTRYFMRRRACGKGGCRSSRCGVEFHVASLSVQDIDRCRPPRKVTQYLGPVHQITREGGFVYVSGNDERITGVHAKAFKAMGEKHRSYTAAYD